MDRRTIQRVLLVIFVLEWTSTSYVNSLDLSVRRHKSSNSNNNNNGKLNQFDSWCMQYISDSNMWIHYYPLPFDSFSIHSLTICIIWSWITLMTIVSSVHQKPIHPWVGCNKQVAVLDLFHSCLGGDEPKMIANRFRGSGGPTQGHINIFMIAKHTKLSHSFVHTNHWHYCLFWYLYIVRWTLCKCVLCISPTRSSPVCPFECLMRCDCFCLSRRMRLDSSETNSNRKKMFVHSTVSCFRRRSSHHRHTKILASPDKMCRVNCWAHVNNVFPPTIDTRHSTLSFLSLTSFLCHHLAMATAVCHSWFQSTSHCHLYSTNIIHTDGRHIRLLLCTVVEVP